MIDVCGGVMYGTRLSYTDAFNNILTKEFWEKGHVDAATSFLHEKRNGKTFKVTNGAGVVTEYPLFPFHFMEPISKNQFTTKE